MEEGFVLAYADEFNGDKLNSERWLPYDGPADWDGSLSVFTGREANVEVKDGSLNLITRREDYEGMHITSGGVRSYGRMVYRYGRLDIRMLQPPTNNGLCTALWLVGYHYSWPSSGEIDIIEQGHGDDIEQGNTPYVFFVDLFGGPQSTPTVPAFGMNPVAPYSLQDGDYHLYTMFWDKDRLLFFLDYDKYPDADPYYAVTIRAERPDDPNHVGSYFHHPFFIIMHMHAQQTAPQKYVVNPEDVTALNDANGHQATMKIDYVRLYQRNDPDEILEYLVPGDGIEPTGVVDSEVYNSAEDSPVIYFNIMGQRVSSTAPGILIRKQGQDVTKIINRR